MKRLLLSSMLSLTVLAPLALVAGCKQKAGERCQVADDCEDGLVCAQATETCATSAGGDIDALPPIDAPADSPVPVDAM
ncbi:MAG: hypothetical protein H0X17_09645, partial [Deltaproteobacteria bacterium]|nr:hypothetical protein [Deltaproteobacteria bacterium]